MDLFLDAAFAEDWGTEPEAVFQRAFALEGEVFRAVKNRRTIRFFFRGHPCFIKVHMGVGYREILKNLLSAKLPVFSAADEYRAIRHLEALGIDTMTPLAFGERNRNPARRESFLVTAELENMTSLENFCADWKSRRPPSKLKHDIIRELARICGLMHRSGLNHRDCYICHFLLDNAAIQQGKPRLFVLDLHRAQIRKAVPTRLRIKDLAGIFFSSMDLGLSRNDALRFIATYNRIDPQPQGRWRAVLKTAIRLYRKEFSREPNL